MKGIHEEVALLAAEVRGRLLEEHELKEWLYADTPTYRFFKERAGKPTAKAPAPAVASPPSPPPQQPQQQVAAARRPTPAPVPVKAPEPPKPVPKAAAAEPPPPPKKVAEPRGAIVLEPLKEGEGLDLGAMRTLMEKTAPHVIVSEIPSFQSAGPRVKVWILALGETTEGADFLDKVCSAVNERLCPARLVRETADAEGTSALIVGSKSALELLPAGKEARLEIDAATVYMADPAKKAALWKELCARCRGL